jgi:hypothetical protein
LAAEKYQVFISSTYEDLKDERDQVIRAVLEMGHIPVGMEMFSAAEDEQWQIIARHIDESDYYAVVVAHRLGSMAPDGVSFTRKEYEYALSKGIPIIGFVIDDSASWPADRVDTGTATKKALTEFKARIKEKPVSFWSNAEDLYGRFTVALMKAITANPREGWVRASSVGGGPEITAEVVRLSAENAALRRKLSEAQEAAEKEQNEERRETVNTLLNVSRTLSYRYSRAGEWQTDSPVSLFQLFRYVGADMIVEASVEDLASSLAMHIRVDQEKPWDLVAVNQVRGVLADLMTLNLVQPSTRKHAVSDTNEYWSLSAFGNEILKWILKVSLTEVRGEEAPEADSDEATNEDDASVNALSEATT